MKYEGKFLQNLYVFFFFFITNRCLIFFLKEFKIYRKIAKIEQRVNIYASKQFPLASSTFNNLHNGYTRNKTRELILARCC